MGKREQSDAHGSEVPSLPSNVREWIANNARQLRAALDNPETRARISELLNEPITRIGTDDE
jgi:hypothetical protein